MYQLPHIVCLRSIVIRIRDELAKRECGRAAHSYIYIYGAASCFLVWSVCDGFVL